MKKILILFALVISCFAVSAQKHNMKYYFDDEEHVSWVLEEKTNYRTYSPIVSPEGQRVHPRAGFYRNRSNPEKEAELVRKILLPVLPRYQSQGFTELFISYIVLPDGSVDEVSFNLYGFRGKLNITQKDMLLWQKLSDALKRELRFVVPADAVKVKFGRAQEVIFISELLNPELRSLRLKRTPKEEVERLMKSFEWVIIEDSDSED